MPNYFYKAKNFSGKTITGVLPSKDIHQLAQDLKNNDLILIEAVLEGENIKKILNFNLPSFRVSLKEKIMMTRNLWIMVSTGLSIVRCLSLLSGQTKNSRFKKALLNVQEEVNKGKGFSESLEKHKDIFSELFLSMVKIGEESGTLEEVLKILSLQMEKEYQLKSKVQSAMIYPGIILLAMLGIGAIIMIFVFPQLTQFFQSLNVSLPIYTKIIIWFGNFFTNFWYFILLGAAILFFGFIKTVKTKKGKWIFDTVLIKLPIISSLVKKNNSAVFIRSLSSLNSSGVPLVRSLEIIQGTVNNSYYKKAILESIEKVKKGDNLSSALKVYENIFPFGAIEIIEVGEETGKSSVILKKLAEFYEEEVITIAENLSAVIEPLLILLLGGGVAFFAFSVIEPMYSILGAI